MHIRRFFVTTIILCFSLGLAFGQTDTLTIFHVNDTHSHLMPWGEKNEQGIPMKGGIARVTTVLQQERAMAKNTLLLHAGDFSVGDAMWNKYMDVPELKILQKLGWDALTIGNHEFEISPDTLQNVLQRAGYPMEGFDLLSANMDFGEMTELAELIQPYTIKTVGNLKIGIFGLTTETTNDFSKPAPVVVTSAVQAARAMVDTLRGKCDFIILLSHLGILLEPSVLDSLAVTGQFIDLVVSGHDHIPLQEPIYHQVGGKVTPIVCSGSYYEYLGKLVVSFAPETGLKVEDYKLIPITPDVPEDPEIGQMVRNLAAEIEADPRYGPMYTEIIAEAQQEITLKSGYGWKDCGLGNLVTDAFRDTTHTDFAIDVWGFMRQNISKGPLTGADIFQAVSAGYDPETGLGMNLVTFELSGFQLRLGLNFALTNSLTIPDFRLQVSGLQIHYSSETGEAVITSFIDTNTGQPVSSFTNYSITTTDGLASFLSLAGLTPKNLQPTGISEYAAVRDFIIKNSPISYDAEGRVQDDYELDVETRDGSVVPAEFSLQKNYPNPFASQTTIPFEIHRSSRDLQSDVTLAIYDVLGRQVKLLTNRALQNGKYTLNWDGTDDVGRRLPNGVYFCRLKMAEKVQIQKILLVR